MSRGEGEYLMTVWLYTSGCAAFCFCQALLLPVMVAVVCYDLWHCMLFMNAVLCGAVCCGVIWNLLVCAVICLNVRLCILVCAAVCFHASGFML